MMGGWGSAKSTWLMERTLQVCGWNGKDRRAKNSGPVPRCAIIAPTYHVLMTSTLSTFYEVCPPELIRQVRSHPNPYIELMNDVIIELHSGTSTLEGSNYFQISADEIHHKKYNSTQITNYISRVRDSESPFLAQNFCGLPEAGHAQQLFDLPAAPRTLDFGGCWTIMCATADNKSIRPETLAAILASCPNDEAELVVSGRWHQASGALFPEYAAELHVIENDLGDPGAMTDVGFDPGQLGGVVLTQPRQRQCRLPVMPGLSDLKKIYMDYGLHVVDEILPENQTITAVCQSIKDKPWRIVPGPNGSRFCVDPTMRDTEREEIKRWFPGVRIYDASCENRSADHRIMDTRAALLDAQQDVRLTFSPIVRGNKRGILMALTGSRRNDKGKIVPDNWLEHVRDALGYVVECRMPRRYEKAGLRPSRPQSTKRA